MAKLKALRLLGCLMLAVFVALSATPSYAASDSGKDFCWKDSYGRGVGTVPKKCASGQDRIGLLCYDKCGKNMKRFGFDCHSVLWPIRACSAARLNMDVAQAIRGNSVMH